MPIFPLKRSGTQPSGAGSNVRAQLDVRSGAGEAARGITQAGASLAGYGLEALAKLKEASDAVESSTAMRKYSEAANEALLARTKSPDAETDAKIDAALKKQVEEIRKGLSNQTVAGRFQNFHNSAKPQYAAKTGAMVLKREIRNIEAEVEVNANAAIERGDVAGATDQWKRLVDINRMSPAAFAERAKNAPFMAQIALASKGQELDPDAATQRIAALSPQNDYQEDLQYKALVRTNRLSSMKNSGDAEKVQAQLKAISDFREAGGDTSSPAAVREIGPDLSETMVYAIAKEGMVQWRQGNDVQTQTLVETGDTKGAKALIRMRIKRDPEYSEAKGEQRIKDLPAESKLRQAKLKVASDPVGALRDARKIKPKTEAGLEMQRSTVAFILDTKAMNADKIAALHDSERESLARRIDAGEPQTTDSIFAALPNHTTKEKIAIRDAYERKVNSLDAIATSTLEVNTEIARLKELRRVNEAKLADARERMFAAKKIYERLYEDEDEAGPEHSATQRARATLTEREQEAEAIFKERWGRLSTERRDTPGGLEGKLAGQYQELKRLTTREKILKSNLVDKPIPLPKEESECVIGKRYITPSGAIGVWNGTKFITE